MSNIAKRLSEIASEMPDKIAIAEPLPKRKPTEKREYQTITFAELDRDSDRIAAALVESGVRPEMRIALMVKQGINFISLVFGIFKSGATLVLIDPGMGLKQMIRCLAEVNLDGFAAISKVQAVRLFMPFQFPNAKYNLTVGRRWFWGGLSLDEIRNEIYPGPTCYDRSPDDAAAIIFTSGSTGVAKGVLFTHGMFLTQVNEIQEQLGIQKGDIDLACFPFFGLFNAAMGVTAVIPDMDSSKPGSVDPNNIIEAVNDWKANQSFGSPALWNRVIDHCEKTGQRFETLTRVVSAGAPIRASMLARLKKCLPDDAVIFTPYGATEALPVAMISADEILSETAKETEKGAGICVGKKFGTIEWKVIGITDAPIIRLDDADECIAGDIGELIVTGPQVTTKYVTRTEANDYAKILDSTGRTWHRMGDVGYLDAQDRFWFCGRKAHRVDTADGPLFSIPCESIFNCHEKVARSALVGVNEEPVIFIELIPSAKNMKTSERMQMVSQLQEMARANPITKQINQFLFYDSFPVDVRHNAKINREKLAEIAKSVFN
ncbi:MAG: fatty acid CoA ligase family protein [Thermoguttaceae bacterium]